MRRAILRISPKVLAAALDVDEATDFIGASVCLTDGAIELVVASSHLPEVVEGARYPTTDLAALQDTRVDAFVPPHMLDSVEGPFKGVYIQGRPYAYEGDINGQYSQG